MTPITRWRSRWTAALALVAAAVALGACGDDDGVPPPPAAPPVVDRFDCEGFVPPARQSFPACPDVDPARPESLVACTWGAGYLGRWAVDGAGLPAYDFTVEQRCDPVARAYSPRPEPLRDPIHLVGNGHGLVAMAHAAGRGRHTRRRRLAPRRPRRCRATRRPCRPHPRRRATTRARHAPICVRLPQLRQFEGSRLGNSRTCGKSRHYISRSAVGG
jgi:hypothetical protein